MDIEFKMPDLATTDSAIKVIGWKVNVGDPVKRGQALLEVETDKAAMDVESIASGILKARHAEPGDELVAGQLLAVIEGEGSAKAASPAAAAAPVAPSAAPAPAKPAGGMFARNRAAAKPAAAPVSDGALALTATQRTAARRLQESKQQVPHFYLQASVNAEPMLRQRTAAAAKPAWDAFFVWAAARALKKFDRLARRYDSDRLVPAGTSDLGVAVDHDGELYVVALTDPAARSVAEISAELRDRVERLRRGDAEARRLRPTVLTITNLGSTRVEAFTAIVNPPEAAILAIGRVTPQAVVEQGAVVVQHRANLTLSADHRVVSGKYAADFLGEIVRELEAL